MTRGAKVRRGVVVLSAVVAGAAGCAAGRSAERVSRAAPPPSRSAVAGATAPTAAGPSRTTEVIDFPVGSWRRRPPSPPARLEIPAIGVSSPLVVRADHRVVRFQVESLARYPKREFPDEEVFGATTNPALRLISCAGDFDRSRRSYRDNLVVSAIRVRDGAGGGSGGAAGR
jgi:hypothetical protein